MRWAEVIAALIVAWRADTELMTALGTGTIEQANAAIERRIPSMRYSVIGDVTEEVMNPISVQVDYWAASMEDAVTIEGRIRAVSLAYYRRSVGGLSMWVTVEDARDMGDPQPGVIHRSLDLRCVPARA